ncbi:MAG: vWA domain-containing protein [Pirellulales bacterium]
MTQLSNRRNRRRSARRGAVLMLVALFIVILVGMAAFAIDLSYIQLSKAQLRSAADAAAKAGAATLRKSQSTSAASSAAIAMAAKNTVNGKAFALSASDIEYGQSIKQTDGSWNFVVGAMPYRAMRVNAKLTAGSGAGPINSIFGKIFGKDNYQTTQTAVASQYDQQLVLCLDRSHSMCFDLSGIDWIYPINIALPNSLKRNPQPGSRWVALEDAVGDFLDILPTTSIPPKLALVTWASDITTSSYEYLVTGKTSAGVTTDVALTANYETVRSAVNSRGDNIMLGGTNMSTGLQRAIDVLNASSDTMAKKSIILMTDGLWNQGIDPTVTAANAKAAGIVVNTITFLPTADQSTMIEIARITGGKHYLATDEASLRAAFVELATSLPVVLTQ